MHERGILPADDRSEVWNVLSFPLVEVVNLPVDGPICPLHMWGPAPCLLNNLPRAAEAYAQTKPSHVILLTERVHAVSLCPAEAVDSLVRVAYGDQPLGDKPVKHCVVDAGEVLGLVDQD